MEINNTFNSWDNFFAFLGIIVGSFVTGLVYKLSKRLSAKDKYDHEKMITEKVQKLDDNKSVILANTKKYNPLRTDSTNKTYYKQGAELYRVIPEYGVQFSLMPSDKYIPIGLVPFEWIEYIREYDSEDNKTIFVCKFNGVRWYKKFKSPFKEISKKPIV